MKMKKLLAGVLSAAMVATMIPASMAFSSVSAVAPDGVVTDGLVSYFTFDGNGTNSVDGATTASFLAEGSASAASIVEDSVRGQVVQIGGAFGSRSYVDLGNDLPAGTTGVSFGGWVKLAEGQVAGTYIDMFTIDNTGTSDLSNWHYFTVSTNGTLHQNNGGYFDGAGTACLTNDGEWHYLVVTSSGTDIDVYVDGNHSYTYTSSATSLPTLATLTDVSGEEQHFYLGYIRQFWDAANCYIDDYAIYNVELTAEQVRANYNATLPDVVDYTSLNSAIATAESIQADSYTAQSYEALQTAIAAAEAKVDNCVTQAEVVEAVNALNTAIDALVIKNGGIEANLISAYEFNGSLVNSVEGAGAAELTGALVQNPVSAASATYTADGQAVKFSNDYQYGLKLSVDNSKITNNTFTVSFNVSYSAVYANRAGMFIATDDQATSSSQLWYSIGNGYSGSGNTSDPDPYYMVWYNDGGYGQVVSDTLMTTDQYTTVTVVFNGDEATLYLNGVEAATGAVPKVMGSETNIYLGANAWDANPEMSVNNAYVYNRALSDNDVEMLYAKNVADTLEVTAVGMQKGSIGENSRSTRFVARVNAAAVDQYNAQIACLGWAYNTGSTLESYSVIDLNTVTSSTEGGLNADDSTYAFTYVVQGNEATPATQMAVAPYVGVTVNGNTYYFCYDGKTGSYNVKSSVVDAPSPFNHVSNTAA